MTITVFFQAAALYAWLTVLAPLSETQTLYSIYLLTAVAAMLCLFANARVKPPRKGRRTRLALGVLFSLAVAAANYSLFTPLRVVENLFDLLCVLLGGAVAGNAIVSALAARVPLEPVPRPRNHPGRIFLGTFLSIAVIDLGFLLFCRYPGVLTTDSFATVGQLLGEIPYDNVMPFYHTITVKLFAELGYGLWGNLNAGIAVFHAAQILFVAACFGYGLTTLYQAGVPGWALAGIYCLWAFLPENIAYSVTLWKDIPFAAACLLMVTALYRLLLQVGSSRKWDVLWLALGAMGFSLWRTNGWYAFAVLVLVLALLLGKREKLLVLFLVGLVLLGAILIGPVLELLGVGDTDFTEAFAIPMQQISRVIVEERPMNAEEEAVVNMLFFQDRVRELYDPETVDPVKFNAFRRESLDWIRENLGQCLKVYVQLGLKYPGDYFKAWVDQTKGYWNGGYDFWTYTLGLGENPYGLYQSPGSGLIARLYAALFRYADKLELLEFGTAIGLYAWTVLACFFTCWMEKRKELVLCVPVLVLLLGLWLGTPVFCEYRYAYPMMLTTPVILAVTVYRPAEKQM